MRNATLLVLIVLTIILTACESEGDRVKKLAEARAIEQKAQVEAEATRQALAIEKTQAEVTAAQRETERFAVFLVLLAFGVGLLLIVLAFAARFLWAIVRGADNRAEYVVLKPDPKTRMYPLLARGNTMTMPSLGMVVDTTRPQMPIPQMVAGETQVRSVGLLADAARVMIEKNPDADQVLADGIASLPVVYGERSKDELIEDIRLLEREVAARRQQLRNQVLKRKE